MEPFATALITLAGLGYSRYREKRLEAAKAEAARRIPAPPEFLPASIQTFTRVDGEVRVFDTDTTEVTLGILSARSVRPLTSEEMPPPVKDPTTGKLVPQDLTKLGQVWQVVPMQEGLPNALELVGSILEQRRRDVLVLGSLSLVLLPSGATDPMLIVIGPTQSAMLAVRGSAERPQGGRFAILKLPEVVEAQPTAPEPAVEPFPAPPAETVQTKKNGVSKTTAEEAIPLPESASEET